MATMGVKVLMQNKNAHKNNSNVLT